MHPFGASGHVAEIAGGLLGRERVGGAALKLPDGALAHVRRLIEYNVRLLFVVGWAGRWRGREMG